MKNRHFRSREATVYCETCQDNVAVSDTEFLNIEEDIQGRDLMTFKCNFCNQEHKSLVRA